METHTTIINGTTFMRITETHIKTETVLVTSEKSRPQPLSEKFLRQTYGFDIACMVEHFNRQLKEVPLAATCLPLTEISVFHRTHEGVLLCAMAKLLEPNSVDEKSVTVKRELLDDSPEGEIRKSENRNIGITALRALGVCITKHAAEAIDINTPFTITTLLVQMLRRVTVNQMHFQNYDVLIHLFDSWSNPEEASSILATDREKMLRIWINYQLKKAKADLELKEIGENLIDSKVYSILLWTVSPEDKRASLTTSEEIMKQTDLTKRAELVIANAEKLGIVDILKPEHIVNAGKQRTMNIKGLQNIVLNMAFLYRIFVAYPNIDVPKMKDKPAAATNKAAAAVTPEQLIKDSCKYGATEDTLIRWLNSFGPSSPVVSLKTDLCNGKVLLEVWDAMFPGSVNWKQVKLDDINTPAKRKFFWVSNCDIAITIGTKHGISRNVCSSGNISAGETKYIASMVFLMMRLHAQLIRKDIIGGSKTADLPDPALLAWFNEKMEKYGSTFRLKSVDDLTLKNTNALGFFGERVLVENNLLSSGPADFPRKPVGGATAGTKTAVGKQPPPPVPPKPVPAKSRNAIDGNLEDAADDNTDEAAQDEEQQQADANNSAGGTWLFNSVEPLASDPVNLLKFSVTAILMFNKAGVIVYASKLGPETDSAVYRSILMELNALSVKTN